MSVYITGTLLSVLFTYISVNIEKSRRLNASERILLPKMFAFLAFIPLTGIMAVRYKVGTDFLSYWNMFLYDIRNVEAGYVFLSNMLRQLTNNPQIIFAVSAIIICGCYFAIIYKESINPVYSVVLFVLCKDYFIAMNGMRQYLSTAIVLLAIPYVKKRDWIKASIIFLVAFSFHRSVIIVLATIAIYLVEIKPLVGGAIMAGLSVLSGVMIQFLYPILLKYGFYSRYFSLRSAYQNASNNFNWKYSLMFFSFFIMLTYEYNSVKKSKELKLMYAGVLCSLFIMMLSAVMPINVSRLTWHMNALIVLYTPHAIRAIHDKRIAFALNIAIPVAYAMVTFSDILLGNQNVLPYQTFWSR